MTFDFGRDIRSARLRRGWSRQRLAEEAGLTPDLVAAIESGDAHISPAPAIAALQLVEVHTLLPEMTAHFLRTIQPVMDQVPEEQVPLVLAAILDVAGRAAAGVKAPPSVGQLNVVAGDATVEHRIS